jgi:hypothetical protein
MCLPNRTYVSFNWREKVGGPNVKAAYVLLLRRNFSVVPIFVAITVSHSAQLYAFLICLTRSACLMAAGTFLSPYLQPTSSRVWKLRIRFGALTMTSAFYFRHAISRLFSVFGGQLLYFLIIVMNHNDCHAVEFNTAASWPRVIGLECLLGHFPQYFQANTQNRILRYTVISQKFVLLSNLTLNKHN